jgi:O-methyltransferase
VAIFLLFFHRYSLGLQFCQVADHSFCFVHIDVELYQPTLDSLAFFYSHMVSDGIVLSDAYGFSMCPGLKQVFNEFIADKRNLSCMCRSAKALW